jgi:glycosyltransferase involved in cell wall biosynthesis
MSPLVVDARKARDAGIGTYIRQVVPRVLDALSVPARVLVREGEAQWSDQPCSASVEVRPLTAAPLSWAEQPALQSVLADGALFWATSLAHPLWPGTRVAATLHDVAQIALPQRDIGASWPVRAGARLLLHSLRRRARALIADSHFTRDEFLRHVGAPACREITVAHLAADAAWFDAAPASHAAPCFVCVGSVRAHKNVKRLLAAFGRVAHLVPHGLRIVGRRQVQGDEVQRLADLPESARARVTFTGLVSDDELRREVAGADALVFPSLYEGFGLPALEAMAAGCPVLASRAGALPEVCGDAAAAYFDPTDVSSIAQALVAHARLSRGARAAIVVRGRAHARSFSWDAAARTTAAVLESTLRAEGLR